MKPNHKFTARMIGKDVVVSLFEDRIEIKDKVGFFRKLFSSVEPPVTKIDGSDVKVGGVRFSVAPTAIGDVMFVFITESDEKTYGMITHINKINKMARVFGLAWGRTLYKF